MICSANVFLTLSGGVGGALLLRYGHAVQKPLVDYLNTQSKPHVPPGTVIPTAPPGTPYRCIIHAVAVDGMYDATPGRITDVLRRSLKLAAESGANHVAVPALATGYGHLTMKQFGEGLRAVLDDPAKCPQVPSRLTVCLRAPHQIAELGFAAGSGQKR